MGFGTELQPQSSHNALVQLGDSELRLLECVRKCVAQRVRCDKDYAAALSAMVATATRMLGSTDVGQQDASPIFQVCGWV